MGRLGFVCGLLIVLAAGCGGGGRLSATELAQQSDSLRSSAAEGALLAQDAASGMTTGVFLREHSTALAEAAARTERALRGAQTDAVLGDELTRLARLAADIRGDLDRLGGASNDEARLLATELGDAAQATRRISEELTSA